jgi:O-antigen ligase
MNRHISIALQLAPLAYVAAALFLLSKPIDNPSEMSLVASGPPPPWWVFPYSIALALIGIAGLASSKARTIAAVVILGAVAYGVRYGAERPPELLGQSMAFVIACLALLSIAGFGVQLAARRNAYRQRFLSRIRYSSIEARRSRRWRRKVSVASAARRAR